MARYKATKRAKRVFKLKTFGRWARKLVTDEALCAAAREIEQGIFEADLGGGVCKKRGAVASKGKSGSTRTLVAKGLEQASAAQMTAMVDAGTIEEICHD